jgi:5-methylcytosine-specific restriction protein A
MPKTWCLHCFGPSTSSYCDECAPLMEAKRDKRRLEEEPWREIYFTKEWERTRRRVLKRDGYRCRVLLDNGARCPVHDRTGVGLQAHHLVALEEGGEPYDLTNLVTACIDHHVELDSERRRQKSQG